MTATGETIAAGDLRDLENGSPVDHILLVRACEFRQTRAGAAFMRLSLADRTGAVTGLVWDDVENASVTARIGDPVRVTGSFELHPRYGAQVTIAALEVPVDVDWDRLLAAPGRPIAELAQQLDALLAGFTDQSLQTLVRRLLGSDSSGGQAYLHAFAAQYNHHAYRSCLLEHSLQVAHTVSAAAEILPGIRRDLAICGALLHDVRKLDAYSGDEHGVKLNDSGKLIGEIPAGYYRVRREIEELPDSRPKRLKHCSTSSLPTTAASSTAARLCR